MSEDIARQVPLPETIRVIRQTLLAPLPANMHVRRDAFGCAVGRPQQVKSGTAKRSDQ